MLSLIDERRDVMQVCANGHVVTDRLRGQPDAGRHHCERCGAATLVQCPTCGTLLPGAAVSELSPVGRQRPPDFCAGCGASFPWTLHQGPPEPVDVLALLALLLRRLPPVVRALRSRHGVRPPFRVADDHDLADLLRALLLLHFEEVRPHPRTPTYAATSRTDLWLIPDRVAVVAKALEAHTPGAPAELDRQWQEDIAYYAGRPDCAGLIGVVYDPEHKLPQPASWERAWTRSTDGLAVRGVIVS